MLTFCEIGTDLGGLGGISGAMAEGPSVGVRRTLAKGGGDGSAVGGTGRCLMSCEPILHRRLRPGRGIDLCFLWMVLFCEGSLKCGEC